MKRSLLLIGLIGMLATMPATRSEPSPDGLWANAVNGAVCAPPRVPEGRICVDWWDPGTEEDGTLCCILEEKRPDNFFGDCELRVGKRARPDSI